jgi:polyhydroxybutyrate depolymerase
MRIPVVFDFHGLGGNEDQMINLSGWADTGDAEGFITVFPGGVDNAWNAGGCCSDTPTDVDFVREAIAYLDSEGCIDTKRIYASGCSNGGAMSYRLACEAADVIAAVAPVDFDCVVGGGCGSCLPSRPIAEIQFRGTNDSLVPFSGAEPNFERWGEINMCSGSPEPLPENSSCQRQPMCADGVESILCTVQNGSHCGSYNSFGIAPLAWQIISRYSLP